MYKHLHIGVFDLTDCEGCELQFVSLREKLAEIEDLIEVTNWRLVASKNSPGPFDVTFIEGSPITESDIEIIKQARRVSKKIVTLGICADLGGVQASFSGDRTKALKAIYGEKYKVQTKAPKPVSYYIDVDIHLPGCPVNPVELTDLLSCLALGKKFTPAYGPVCLECKAKNNPCLFLDEGFCLGPVTKGGCGAPCPSAGLRCYGCFGPIPDANLEAMEKDAKEVSSEDVERSLAMFFHESPDFKLYKEKRKK